MPQPTIEQPEEGSTEIGRFQMMALQASRDDFLDEVLDEGKYLYEHPYRACREIRFESTQRWNARSWRSHESLGAAQAFYVELLGRLENVVRATEKSGNVRSLDRALLVVVEAANKLGFLGYKVNWEQNVRWAFRASSYGLTGYSVANRYEPTSDRLTLTERLEILGSLTFWKQSRRGGKLSSPVQAVFSKSAEETHGTVMLSVASCTGRYVSDWHDDREPGTVFRLLSD